MSKHRDNRQFIFPPIGLAWTATPAYHQLHAAWTRALQENRYIDAQAIRQEMAACP